MTQVRLMIVEDSLTIRAILEGICERAGDCQVVGLASDAEAARDLMADCLPNVIALDLGLPGINGMDFLTELAEIPHAPVVVVSSAATRGSPIIKEARRRGAVACFDKALLVAEAGRLVRMLRRAADDARLREHPEEGETANAA